mmetsp:Transcript_70789/g.124911  ORF Transcript_70789/g.124911 Transcript_70789/m.124911 type:complete len:299 (+) Transcript_70789:62-958(+)|eukprot:CAMPEP_0197654828 /NCGR_PEP_ID=MMETSP1338-20131121/39083_1 /TAXON_ID=43686 ORGANISM="Pelagodinium beii, Strain RCC1491" /NCGR_SAMPLE_ID=MMETSP1338 /ASSEMBLY_ACC=CAM_ASM_000754 /LENGTH=298 /DNA_ID=CAMNT_0043230345 /DNA_START=62 /DNA_END=958 /DNA_ORIENTATION=+
MSSESRRLELGIDLTSLRRVSAEPLDPDDRRVRRVLGGHCKEVANKVSKLNSAASNASLSHGGSLGLWASLAFLALMLFSAMCLQSHSSNAQTGGYGLLQLLENINGPPSDMLSAASSRRHSQMQAEGIERLWAEPSILESKGDPEKNAQTRMNHIETSVDADGKLQQVMRKASSHASSQLELDEVESYASRGATQRSSWGDGIGDGTNSPAGAIFIIVAVLLGFMELAFLMSSAWAFWEVQNLAEELEAEVAHWNETMHPLHFSIEYKHQQVDMGEIIKGAHLIIENRSQNVTYRIT